MLAAGGLPEVASDGTSPNERIDGRLEDQNHSQTEQKQAHVEDQKQNHGNRRTDRIGTKIG